MASKINLWQKLDRFSPMTVRLLARKRSSTGRPLSLSDAEIASMSGLTLAEVKRISWSTTWDEIPVGQMRAFTRACGVDLGRRRDVQQLSGYMKRGCRFGYLRRSPDWKTVFEPLVTQWLKS